MIFGIGNDILNIERLQHIVAKHSLRFAQKILSPIELGEWHQLKTQKQLNYLAKRWSAKEAFSKACGTGIRSPVLFSAITVSKDDLGKPLIITHGDLSTWISDNHIKQIHLSLSDDLPYCMAVVVLEFE